ncbi:MAG: NACHT domain-containing NTPase [Cyanobacteria bacterium J06638_22]
MLSRDFLTQLAQKYALSPEQAAAFVALFSRSDDDELEAADTLNISHSAFRTRLTGVYSKFSIGGAGPGKFYRLQNFLLQEYLKVNPSRALSIPEATVDIELLVQEMRQQVRNDIQKRCGMMRVLDMAQPITLDSIYTSVNILEKISRNQRRSIEELLEGCNLEDFDRLSLSKINQERIPGLEAVERHDKLLILGKPGAGKTTFLKWLALQCNAGQLHPHRVPLFVTLKEFAEASGQPDLLSFIANQWTACEVENAPAAVKQLLQAGRAVILLDGLDEVRSDDHDRVLKTIRQTARQFDANQFVMTCRIAAREYTFEQFTEVEVADFDDEQITDFSQKWFQPKDPIKAAEFPKALESQPNLQELATNPLLLTLLCLVFEERAGFPANRSELYQEGVDVLLKKWDAKRNIKRDEVYKQLSLQRKEDLLSQIACTAFERSEYFLKQKFVEEEIRDYIRNLPKANLAPDALQLDSEVVLRAIEAQHGLLVERARGIYSFSHLTFQEYFTARQFKEKTDGEFGALVKHVTEPRWREVFLLTVGMLKNADKLLLVMQQHIDDMLAQDERLQQFLGWVEQKANSVTATYQSAAIRAFYFGLDRAIDRDRTLNRDLSPALTLNLDLDLALTFALDRDLAVALTIESERDRAIAMDLDHAIAHTFNRDRTLDFDFDRDRDLDLDRALSRALAQDLDRALECAQMPKLQQMLKYLRHQVPDCSLENFENFRQWWTTNGSAWLEQLQDIIIEHRNIGHDWQFSKAQQRLLQQYYNTNKLLVDCLNSDCYVSREVREQIETTLLLPIASQRDV